MDDTRYRSDKNLVSILHRMQMELLRSEEVITQNKQLSAEEERILKDMAFKMKGMYTKRHRSLSTFFTLIHKIQTDQPANAVHNWTTGFEAVNILRFYSLFIVWAGLFFYFGLVRLTKLILMTS